MGSLLLAVLLLPPPAALSFSDVPSDSPAAQAIAEAERRGIIHGYGDGTFRPTEVVARAEFLKILLGFLPSPAVGNPCRFPLSMFTDVEAGAWYAPTLCAAAERGIVRGYPDGTLRPAQTVNFVEAAVMIARAEGTATATSAGIWYKSAVDMLAARAAIPLQIGVFEEPLRRGTAIEILMRLAVKETNKPSRTYEDLAGTGEWNFYASAGYVFRIPAVWEARELPSTPLPAPTIEFIESTSGARVGTLQCPAPVPSGSEPPALLSRSYEKNGKTHGAELRHIEASSPEHGKVVILMHEGSAASCAWVITAAPWESDRMFWNEIFPSVY